MSRKKDMFKKDLPQMMYGFGDVEPKFQDEESIELLNQLAEEYIYHVMNKVESVARNKITANDIKFVLRKDKRKYENNCR